VADLAKGVRTALGHGSAFYLYASLSVYTSTDSTRGIEDRLADRPGTTTLRFGPRGYEIFYSAFEGISVVSKAASDAVEAFLEIMPLSPLSRYSSRRAAYDIVLPHLQLVKFVEIVHEGMSLLHVQAVLSEVRERCLPRVRLLLSKDVISIAASTVDSVIHFADAQIVAADIQIANVIAGRIRRPVPGRGGHSNE